MYTTEDLVTAKLGSFADLITASMEPSDIERLHH
jgi:hypothetical protein